LSCTTAWRWRGACRVRACHGGWINSQCWGLLSRRCRLCKIDAVQAAKASPCLSLPPFSIHSLT
jgi:hypothetical protein